MRIEARTLALGTGAVAVVAAAWVGLDALVVTDEERLGAFSDAVAGTVDADRVAAVTRQWTDTSVQPVEVRAFGRVERYDGSTEESLEDRARAALRPYGGDTLRRLRESITVEGERGQVSLRLLGDRGMVEVDFELVRHGERWLVSEVTVHR